MSYKMNEYRKEASIASEPCTRIGKASLETLRNAPPHELARLGLAWNGGKAVGLPRGELMPTGVSVADFVIEDRR
jgi:hypothetical protein